MQNFNNNRLNIFDAVEQQQKQIDSLKADLERLRANPKATDRLIFFKEQQIKVFESVIETILEYSVINDEIFSDQQKQIAKLKDENFKLIGVCMYHGISDLNYYLRMKTNALIQTVKRAFTEGWRQTPFELKTEPIRTDIKELRGAVSKAQQIQTTVTKQIHGKENNQRN